MMKKELWWAGFLLLFTGYLCGLFLLAVGLGVLRGGDPGGLAPLMAGAALIVATAAVHDAEVRSQ